MDISIEAPVRIRRPHPSLAARATALLDEIAADEDEHWGGGSISASAYETAWVALVRDPRHPNALAFPESLIWLLRAQQPDGRWGPPFPYALVPTLAALLALRRCPWQTEPLLAAAARAERALRRALESWRANALDTPFFEFLVPLLAAELAETGLHLPVPDLDLMCQRRAAKLTRLPLPLLYAGRSNLVHALESISDQLEFTRVTQLRVPFGGYGYSPSATAAVLRHGKSWDDVAAAWLRQLPARTPGALPGAMPTSHPADTFEAAWALHVLLHGGLVPRPADSPALRAMALARQFALTRWRQFRPTAGHAVRCRRYGDGAGRAQSPGGALIAGVAGTLRARRPLCQLCGRTYGIFQRQRACVGGALQRGGAGVTRTGRTARPARVLSARHSPGRGPLARQVAP